MSCEYCKGSKNILNSRTRISLKNQVFPGLEAFIDANELSFIAVADTYEPNYQEECVEINFCPMCGEKLAACEIDTCSNYPLCNEPIDNILKQARKVWRIE